MSSQLPAHPGQSDPAAPSPPRAPSFLHTDSVSTLEGNVLKPVPRAGPSCHPPSCWDPGVRIRCQPAARPGTRIQLLTHQRWGGGLVGRAGAEVAACSTPNRPPPPGSQPALPATFPSARPSAFPTLAQANRQSRPYSSGMGSTCPRWDLRSLGHTAAHRYMLVFTSPSWKNIV